MSFAHLGLSETLLRAVADLGHQAPTPVQERTIPLVMAGRDLLAAAQTGTGKTAAFAIPVLTRLKTHAGSGSAPRALVLTPTRELAAQVAQSFRDYGRHMSLRSEAVTAASACTIRSRPCAAASISSSPPPDGCSITSSGAR